MRPARFPRWLLPATMISLACAGIAFLFLGDAAQEPAALGFTPAKVARAQPSPPARVVLRSLPPASPRASAAPASPRTSPPPAPAPARGPEQARETPAVLRASPWLVKLAKASGLPERYQVVDDLLVRLPPEQAVEVLAGLVDSILPGEFYEAEGLRLYVMGRLGALPGPRAEAVLVERLEPERPRPQRLLAVELLAVRPGVGRGELAMIARGDHDQVVQEKARRALERVQ